MTPEKKDTLDNARSHRSTWLGIFDDAIDASNGDDTSYLKHEKKRLMELLDLVSDMHPEEGGFKSDLVIDSHNGEGAGLPLNVSLQTNRIDVSAADGRSIWIETEDGDLKVHVYDEHQDEPINLNLIKGEKIEVDRHDYDENSGQSLEM